MDEQLKKRIMDRIAQGLVQFYLHDKNIYYKSLGGIY